MYLGLIRYDGTNSSNVLIISGFLAFMSPKIIVKFI